MRLAIALCISLLIATPLSAQSASLRKAFDARNAAVRAGAGKEWRKYATDDFSMTRPDGTVITKEQRVAEIEGHPLTTLAPAEVQWRVYGDAAIETSRVTPQGKPARLIVVWVRQGKNWKVAAAQFTPIAAP